MSFLKNLFGKKDNPQILSPEEFVNEYFNFIEDKFPNAQLISYNDLELEISVDGSDKTFKSFLDNAYLEYKNYPAQKEEVFEKYIKALIEMINYDQEEDEVTEESIFPMVKNYDFLISNKKIDPNFEEDSFYEKLNDELYVFYVINSKNTFRYLQKSSIEEYNLPLDNIKEIATKNLNNLEEEIRKQGDNGLYQIIFDGNFEATLILLDIWSKDNFDVKGEIVIAIPARDVLLVTGSEDKENLLKVKDIAIDICQTGDHIITDKLFTIKDHKLEIFS